MIYFAYGSNLNKDEIAIRCPNAKCLGSSFLKGWQLVFRSYLTIEKKKGEEVPIGIWDVPDEDMKYLDRYEGYPQLYRKEKITIDGKEGIIYIMNENKIPYKWPSEKYLDSCAQGYLDFMLSISYLRQALDTTYKKRNR